MTTWAQPVRHPWYDPPTTKRKLCADDDDDASLLPAVSPATLSTRRRKRARYGSLERTLAHMTLGNALSEDVDARLNISLPHPREQAALNVILPNSVEEPGVLASEEGDMEVDPTLVTTDMSATSPPPPYGTHDWAGQLEIKEVQISSAVLECLRRQPKYPPAPIPLPSQTSQALILYHTPPPPFPLGQMHEDQAEKLAMTPILVAHDDDVMEVE